MSLNLEKQLLFVSLLLGYSRPIIQLTPHSVWLISSYTCKLDLEQST